MPTGNGSSGDSRRSAGGATAAVSDVSHPGNARGETPRPIAPIVPGEERVDERVGPLSPDGFPLGLMQRILVTTDGTVTHVLEAYTGERIRVLKVSEANVPWDDFRNAQLDLSGGETVVKRTVLLRGAQSGENLIYAVSRIAMDRLPARLRAELLGSDDPLGRLIGQHRLETFREILVSGQEPAGARGTFFGMDEKDMMIFRTYRIIMNARPVMLITERFPATAFVV